MNDLYQDTPSSSQGSTNSATEPGGHPNAPNPAWLILLAGLASAIIPGTGQFLRKRYRRGAFFLLIWIALVFASAALRLWANAPLFGLIMLVFIGCGLCAAFDAAFHAISPRRRKATYVAAVLFIPAAAFAINVPLRAWKLAGFQYYSFPSSSMEPTINPGERFVGDSRYYSRHSVQRGDVVSLLTKDGFITLKRVVAVPGDTIEGKDRAVYLNGKVIEEPYIQHSSVDFTAAEFLNTFGPVKLGDAEYFVMGDNRDVSLDSRSPDVGTIPQSRIKGKALYLFSYPTSHRTGRTIQ